MFVTLLNNRDAAGTNAQIDKHLFWGTASTPDAELEELKLHRGQVFHEYDGSIKRQTYYVFPPQEPGLYKWRYVYDDHG